MEEEEVERKLPRRSFSLRYEFVYLNEPRQIPKAGRRERKGKWEKKKFRERNISFCYRFQPASAALEDFFFRDNFVTKSYIFPTLIFKAFFLQTHPLGDFFLNDTKKRGEVDLRQPPA